MFTQEEKDLIVEVCLNKDLEDMTWEDVTEYLNEILGKTYRDSKTYRNVFNDYMTVKESEAIVIFEWGDESVDYGTVIYYN